MWPGVVVHTFNPSTQKGRWVSVSSKAAWSSKQIPGQVELLYKETLSQKSESCVDWGDDSIVKVLPANTKEVEF